MFARLAIGIVAAIGVAACFSERSSGPGPDPILEGCSAQLPAEAFGSTIVRIQDFAFTPAQVRIRPGTKVTWVNCDPAGQPSHTSTADGGSWNSALLPPGATFTREFGTATGAFPYHCEPHPGMRGTVTVE